MNYRIDYKDCIVLACLGVIFLIVSAITDSEKALAFSVSLGVFSAVVQSRWESRSDPRMWVLVAVVALVQSAIIFLVKIPRVPAGLICLPFALIETYALWGLIGWLQKHPRRSGPHSN